MLSIMERSFAKSFGLDWPADAAAKVNGRYVTWAEVHAIRRKDQKLRMNTIRFTWLHPYPDILPAYVWTFLVPGWLFAGWHCYIVTRKESFSVRDDSTLAVDLMKSIPLGILPMPEYFNQWMAAFAQKYKRHGVKDPRQSGTLVGWYDRKRKAFKPIE